MNSRHDDGDNGGMLQLKRLATIFIKVTWIFYSIAAFVAVACTF
jgi:hypothetical protein